jgi:hypothetical protein
MGLVVGLAVGLKLSREYSRHWMWIVAISVVAGIIWLLIFNSHLLDTNTNDLS